MDDRLQSVGDPRVFAAGDSASLASWPDTPKAVYAVRMGPRLVPALAHALGDGARPTLYRPQQRFPALANAGDGTALASWGLGPGTMGDAVEGLGFLRSPLHATVCAA
ncbi:MAG: hypothetical protein IPF47_13940 [Gemmatimonadetes bacterium]|nr:hypothetical protein [Gemmatimonadota bacterium]